MEHQSMLIEKARELYTKCDPNCRGFVTREDLSRLKGHIPAGEDQLDAIFTFLDNDKQGSITFEAFLEGFGAFFESDAPSIEHEEVNGEIRGSDSDEEQLSQTLASAGAEFLLKEYEQVSRIWKQLKLEQPSLLPDFEKMLASIAKELQTAKAEHENMNHMVHSKLSKQEEHLGRLFEELEHQFEQEKERLLEQERAKERKLKEELAKELQEKDRLATELNFQYEQSSLIQQQFSAFILILLKLQKDLNNVRSRMEELNMLQNATLQEKERFIQEKNDLEKRLNCTQSALDDCKEYIEILQKKAREDRKNRAKAAIELSEGIALERENLVRQLDYLRYGGLCPNNVKLKSFGTQFIIQLINQKLLDDREERRLRGLTNGGLKKDTRLNGTIASQLLHRKRGAIGGKNDKRENSRSSVECSTPESTSDMEDTRAIANTNEAYDSELARRGSVMGSYFGAVVPHQTSQETDLEEIMELEEDEKRAFDSVQAKETERPVGENVLEHTTEDMKRNEQTHGAKTGFAKKGDVQRVYKITFVGESGVGKSSVINWLMSETYVPAIEATIAIDFCTKFIQCDDTDIILQLWDTAGQESPSIVPVRFKHLIASVIRLRFRSITRQYYRRSDAVVLVFDVTDEQSFAAIRGWIDSVRDGIGNNTVLMILSNKQDKLESGKKQVVTTECFERLIKEYKAIGFEISAVSGLNINHAFMELARLLKNKEDDELRTMIQLKEDSVPTKKSCCG
ncbi:Ras and EF-hand domain-containing protein [Paragonimus westermani]|uniref:Ras and EF-hand domain-containing protein n=1 Tax=Paragonimus westermani TaxID=34504 RepID=A0A5J4NK54_9TREM|nr:Ras and EF-hand domain-containing protein [Paragonimus westermani]